MIAAQSHKSSEVLKARNVADSLAIGLYAGVLVIEFNVDSIE
jgi:hypothetical protein